MITEAILLVGGLGTRLRDAVPDLPKCMAPINGRPFIDYLIEHFQKEGIQRFIFSAGYKHEVIEKHLQQSYSDLNYKMVIETEPLGTGGGIKLCCKEVQQKNVLVANGDTIFKLDVKKLSSFHEMCGADCTLSLKPMTNFDRYGVVELNADYSIQSFREKKHYDSGLINAGVYALNAGKFLNEDLPEKFSIEKDYLEKYYAERKMYGVAQDVYFIDIGIPQDFQRAQIELKG